MEKMTLDELAIKYGSDKSSQGGHGYCEFYEKHLPKNPKKILEIGVLSGSSIAMWSEYFPDTEIWGLDLFAEISISEAAAMIISRNPNANLVKLVQGNQCDWLLLEQLRKEDFDVIIDDGSHNSRDQMMTFFGLFNGKHYFIEDLHCCLESFYQDGLPYEFTADNVFSALEEDRNVKTMFGNKIVCIHAT